MRGSSSPATLGLPPERLWVTVYEDDDDAADHLARGDRRRARAHLAHRRRRTTSGRWATPGPCGPCSEIFYDHGPGRARAGRPARRTRTATATSRSGTSSSCSSTARPTATLDAAAEALRRHRHGPRAHRRVMQGVHSNYDIDLFREPDRAPRRRPPGRTDLQVDLAARHRRPHPRLFVPDRRRRAARQRGPRLRAAPDHPPRDPPRLHARPATSRSSTRSCRRWTRQMGDAYPELRAQARARRARAAAGGGALCRDPVAGHGAARRGARRACRARSFPARPSSSSTTPTASRSTSPRTSRASAASRSIEAGFERAMEEQRERARAVEHASGPTPRFGSAGRGPAPSSPATTHSTRARAASSR